MMTRQLTKEHKEKISKSLKGIKRKPFTEEHRKKLSEAKKGKERGENHPNWKGDKSSYRAVHQWVERWKGKPDKCEICGKDGLKSREIQWANKSGEYKRDKDDWERLCVKCHFKKYKHNHKFLRKQKYEPK